MIDRKIVKLIVDVVPKEGIRIIRRKMKVTPAEAKEIYWKWRREYVSEIKFEVTGNAENYWNMRGCKVGNNQYSKQYREGSHSKR